MKRLIFLNVILLLLIGLPLHATIINIPDQTSDSPDIAGDHLFNDSGNQIQPPLGFTFSCTHFTIVSSEDPGEKSSRIPAALSLEMSSSGKMPPPQTTISSAPLSFRSSTTLGKRYM